MTLYVDMYTAFLMTKTPRRGDAVPRREDTPRFLPRDYYFCILQVVETRLFILNKFVHREMDGESQAQLIRIPYVHRITRILCGVSSAWYIRSKNV